MRHFTKSLLIASFFIIFYSVNGHSQGDINVTIYEDLNGNGALDGGDPTIAVTPTLWEDPGNIGIFSPSAILFNGIAFPNAPAGNYEVRYPATSGTYILLTPASGVESVTVAASPLNLTAGYYQAASIGDFVWHDLNGNGIQDGEPGLSITVNLNGTTGLGVPVGISTASDGAGAYNFPALQPGDYIVSFVLPSANHFFTAVNATGDTQDSDANMVSGDSPIINLMSNDVIIDVDAGLYIGATIGDFVWDDLNGNGIQDGEPGLGGVSVNLNGTNGAGIPVTLGPILTNGAGNYSFIDLAPGTYTVSFVLPSANHFFSMADQTGDTQDSDPNPLTGMAPPILIVSADDITHIDAGIFQGATISDYVWEDMNGNGTQDGGEPALGGVMISITTSLGGPVTKADGTPAGPVFSTGTGAYLFDVLVPGDYILDFATNLPGHYRTVQGVGGAAIDSDPNMMTGLTNIVNVISNQIVTNIDGGYYRAGQIGDFTWIDFNGDGLQNDPNPLDGVNIAITDNLGAGVNDVFGAPIGPVNSAGGGMYSFPNLKPGMYRLTFNSPGGYFPTRLNAAGGATDATDVGNDSDVDQGAGNMTYIVTIESGEIEDRLDGGFYQPVTIGNFVWHDANADGIQDAGEMGEPGVTVTLTNADGSPLTNVNNGGIAPTVTGAAGDYQFINVRPGLYNIAVTAPPMWFFSDPDATGDASDSDFTMAGNLVASVQLNSNDINNDIDAGIYKNINLIGTVWVEQDDNGMQDIASENGAAGVTVQIFTDPGMVLSGTNVTNAMGEYMFSVKPGDYIVSIGSGNFGSGNPLNGLESCTLTNDPNDDVDLDDNGSGPMSGPIVTAQLNLRCGLEPDPDGVTNETVDFCFKFNCGAENSLSAPSCETVVDTFCNLTILDAGCATMPGPPLVGPAPNPLCDGGGAPHNMSWFAFIAGTGNYEIEIVPYGCLPGSGGQLGMQAGVYTDCTFTNSVFCMNACSTSNINIPSDNLIPGNTYYFWFDGCSGSVCSYEINVNGSFTEYIIPEPTEVVCASDVCTPVCPDTDITLQVNSGYENAKLKFNWKITSPSGVESFVETIENFLDYNVTELGTYIFEIVDIRNKCNRTFTSQTFEVVVRHPNDEDFGKVDLCENFILGWSGPQTDMVGNSDPNGDGTPGWQKFPYTFTSGINTTTIMQDGCIYDQTVELEELIINPAFKLDLVLCPDEIPYTYSTFFPTILGQMPETRIILLGQQENGCDSLVDLTVTVLESLFGAVDNEGCIDGKTKFRLNNAQILDFPVITTFRWRNAAGNIVNDGNPDFDDKTILLTNAGSYTCEIVMTLGTKTCIKEIQFDLVISSLETPVGINWPLLFCATTTQSVFQAQSSQSNPNWVWTYPAGVTVTGETTNALTVNWNGVLGGMICVSVADDCGASEEYCRTVVITPIPTADFVLDTLICIDSTASAIFSLPKVVGTTYTWTLDGGSIISTPGSNGTDSLEINWATSGKKYITLQITRNGCISPIVTDSLIVVDLVTPPAISCNAGATQIEFIWTPIAGQTGTNVTVITGPTGVDLPNAYLITGLLPGVTVDIEVEFLSNHPCGNVISAGSCITQNCTPETVTFSAIPSICLAPNSPTIDLKNFVTTQTPGGIYTFTGTGVNTLTGIFDPNVAGVGTHQLRFVYKDLLGCTSSAAFSSVIINPIPTSTFTVSPVICQDSTSIINYTGSITSGGTFTWDFGGGTVVTGSGVGPYSVRWATPGTKTVTLTAARNGCISSPSMFNVTVQPRIDSVVIKCPTIGTTVLTFDWNDILNITDFSLTLNGQPLPNQTASILSLNTLPVNTNYTLVVTANSNNACPGKSATLLCRTTDCPPVSIKFSIKDTTICSGANLPTIDIDAIITGGLQSPNQTITWSGPGVNPVTGVFDPNVAGAGTHNIKVSLVDGTCTKDTSMKITIIAKPLSTFTGLAKICITNDYIVNFTGTTNLPLNWQLQTGVTFAPAGTGKYKITFPQDGNYTIGLTVGNVGCFSDLTSLNVAVEPKLDTVKITCQQTTSSVTFNWNDIDCASQYKVEINSVARGTQSTLTYLTSGLIVGEKVEIIVTPISECACPAVATVKVCEAKQCPNIALSLTSPVPSFCQGANTTPFQMQSTVTGTNNTGIGQWSGANVSPSGMFNPAGKTAGTYKMFYDFTEEGCDFRDSVSIIIFPVPSLAITSTQPICYSANIGSADYVITGGTPAITYTLDGISSTPPLNNVVPGNYQVIATDINMCKDTATFTISGVTEPTLSLSGNTLVTNGASTELTATITGLTETIDSIVWVDMAGNIICKGTDCLKVVVTPKTDERYCATVYYNNGCNVDECINVKVQKIISISIPNVISVNGNNPSFYVAAYPNFKLIKSMNIYDRWGNLVFSKENVAPGDASQGWDGRLNSTSIVAGVYVYKIEIELTDGKSELFVGDVTVLSSNN